MAPPVSALEIAGRRAGLEARAKSHSSQVDKKQGPPLTLTLCLRNGNRAASWAKDNTYEFVPRVEEHELFPIPLSESAQFAARKTAASNVSVVPPVSATSSHSARRDRSLFRGTRQSKQVFGLYIAFWTMINAAWPVCSDMLHV